VRAAEALRLAVPLFVVHAKGLERTSAHPSLLYGYSCFSILLTRSSPPFALCFYSCSAALLRSPRCAAVVGTAKNGNQVRRWGPST